MRNECGFGDLAEFSGATARRSGGSVAAGVGDRALPTGACVGGASRGFRREDVVFDGLYSRC